VIGTIPELRPGQSPPYQSQVFNYDTYVPYGATTSHSTVVHGHLNSTVQRCSLQPYEVIGGTPENPTIDWYCDRLATYQQYLMLTSVSVTFPSEDFVTNVSATPTLPIASRPVGTASHKADNWSKSISPPAQIPIP
jgi:hypothetical protein